MSGALFLLSGVSVECRPGANAKGCFTCRARKVKCDLSRPICQTCIRLNLDCTYTKPDKQLNIPRLRRGRKRRTSETGRDESVSTENEERRGSTNTMPDLWGYQGYDLHPKPMARMSLDHGHGNPYGLGRGGAPGQGMGDDGLASSAYLNSLLRPQPRRESMPIMLPSNYHMGGYGMGQAGGGVQGQNGRGEQHDYRSPTPNAGLQNLFNGYQIGPSGGTGHATTTNGCTRELPRSITPASSTQMATPQGWDMSGAAVSHPYTHSFLGQS